jgi:hypothetical protein
MFCFTMVRRQHARQMMHGAFDAAYEKFSTPAS